MKLYIIVIDYKKKKSHSKLFDLKLNKFLTVGTTVNTHHAMSRYVVTDTNLFRSLCRIIFII